MSDAVLADTAAVGDTWALTLTALFGLAQTLLAILQYVQ